MEESDRKESTISTPDPPSKTDQEREKNINVEPIGNVAGLKFFPEPRIFLVHVLQTFKVMAGAVVTYLKISCVGVLLFSLLFFISGVDGPIKESCKIYWSFGTSGAAVPRLLAFVETVYRDFVSVCMLGKIVAGLIIPNNPIEFSKFFIVNKNGEIQLRYWIMLPVGNLLHAPRLRIMLIKDEEFTKGDGPLNAEVDESWTYSGIRGIRTHTLDIELSKTILKELKKEETKCKMAFMISGALVEGRQYFSEQKYTYEDLLYADGYLNTRNDEDPTNGGGESMPVLKKKGKLPPRMYMNFNMAYRKEGDRKIYFFKPFKPVRLKGQKLWDKKCEKILDMSEDWGKWVFFGLRGKVNRRINKMAIWKYDNKNPLKQIIERFKKKGEN